MRMLVTGSGKSGSWKIRGEQLGEALGATVLTAPKKINKYHLVILVKRPMMDVIQAAHLARIPIVYDIVDAWQQLVPANEKERKPYLNWLSKRHGLVQPAAWVAATNKMAEDCREVAPLTPVLALPHHSRPNMERNPIRAVVKTVGYEGSEKYLGKWREFLTEECQKRGWEFIINPPSLADVDIVVAVRNEIGYGPKNWKSNVKLANAQGSGTPCILNSEAGYIEHASGAECWADTEYEMRCEFDKLTPYPARVSRAEQLYRYRLDIQTVVQAYNEWLYGLKF